MEKEIKKEVIRSEMTHAQEVSIIHSAPPEELIERIRNKLIALKERSVNSDKNSYNRNIRCRFKVGNKCRLLLYSLLGKIIDEEEDLPCEDCEMRERTR